MRALLIYNPTAGDEDVDPDRGLDQARRVRFDVGLASWDGDEHPFLESAGCGIFADVLIRADEVENESGGDEKIELGLRFLRQAAEDARVCSCRVVVDGADLSAECIALEASNVSLVSVNVTVAPDARPGDGLLDLALVRAGDRPTLMDYAIARLERRSPSALDLEVRRATRIELGVPPEWPFHLDSERVRAPAERYSLSVGPRLEVLVPR